MHPSKPARPAKLDSAIIYDGPSRLDTSARIVAILTNIRRKSSNPKTGNLAQLWVIRADMHPLEAIRRNRDGAICGSCGLRGSKGKSRGCYVVVANAPSAIYRKFRRTGKGKGYQRITPTRAASLLSEKNRNVRLGAYGDPATLPVAILATLTRTARHTGYTHSWQGRPALASLVMASADSPQDARTAQAMGYRTFRTRTADQPLMPNEISCPASAEQGHQTTCEKCLLCDGSRGTNDGRKNIAIVVHGSPAIHAMAFLRSRVDAMAVSR